MRASLCFVVVCILGVVVDGVDLYVGSTVFASVSDDGSRFSLRNTSLSSYPVHLTSSSQPYFKCILPSSSHHVHYLPNVGCWASPTGQKSVSLSRPLPTLLGLASVSIAPLQRVEINASSSQQQQQQQDETRRVSFLARYWWVFAFGLPIVIFLVAK